MDDRNIQHLDLSSFEDDDARAEALENFNEASLRQTKLRLDHELQLARIKSETDSAFHTAPIEQIRAANEGHQALARVAESLAKASFALERIMAALPEHEDEDEPEHENASKNLLAHRVLQFKYDELLGSHTSTLNELSELKYRQGWHRAWRWCSYGVLTVVLILYWDQVSAFIQPKLTQFLQNFR